MKRWRVIIASLALAVGAAAGWFAARAWGERKCGNVELCNCGNVETANDGRARSPVSPERSEPRRRPLGVCAPLCSGPRGARPLPWICKNRRCAPLHPSSGFSIMCAVKDKRSVQPCQQ